MLISNIHAYFAKIKLDPVVGWEILETMLDDPINEEVRNERHLRFLLAEAIVTYIDMAHDDEDAGDTGDSTFYRVHVLQLLNSRIPLTLHEQYTILGAAAWWPPAPLLDQVRLLTKRQVLPPADAVEF